jgi:hypothetical protein
VGGFQSGEVIIILVFISRVRKFYCLSFVGDLTLLILVRHELK